MPSGVQTCALDRKSTRLNSSHGSISYAVFCLKKKYSPPGGCMRGSTCCARPSHTPTRSPWVEDVTNQFVPPTMALGAPTDEELFFFFNDTATTEIYTLSLHDALPI